MPVCMTTIKIPFYKHFVYTPSNILYVITTNIMYMTYPK